MATEACVHDTVGETEFYRRGLMLLHQSGYPFLVGGAFALQHHVGVIRRTKDLDVFVLADDIQGVLDVFKAAGYRTALPFTHWLGKVFCGDCLLDVIFGSGNGICRVDRRWFEHAPDGQVLGIQVKLCPVEETIWQKSFVLERDRCDVADVAHLLLQHGSRLDWPRLVERFEMHWPLLAAQLVLFDFIYPDHRACIPDEVRNDLLGRLIQAPKGERPPRARCHGPLLSATQYLDEVVAGDFDDARKSPPANMTEEQIAVWTANFVKP
jgi:hypothetical protein